ncbi:membrane protein (plasmid) [Rhodococcus erythropolis R138]|uniref:DoxX family protein n=1 Tax=Rhodococcus erythropolis TaxID=1833 RepID=UPI000492DD88|nr:DoxX family protein [Rhodococcus erythropolis]ALU73415.1 membrane protein [Rhodococcus erythropolis R138]
MTIAFYIVAGLAALVFLAAGLMKLTQPKPALVEKGLTWVEDFPSSTVKLIGAAEVLGAIGLIVPAATNVAPALSPIAATALTIVMLGAAVVHLRRKEAPGLQIGLAVLAAVAAVLGFLTVI